MATLPKHSDCRHSQPLHPHLHRLSSMTDGGQTCSPTYINTAACQDDGALGGQEEMARGLEGAVRSGQGQELLIKQENMRCMFWQACNVCTANKVKSDLTTGLGCITLIAYFELARMQQPYMHRGPANARCKEQTCTMWRFWLVKAPTSSA